MIINTIQESILSQQRNIVFSANERVLLLHTKSYLSTNVV